MELLEVGEVSRTGIDGGTEAGDGCSPLCELEPGACGGPSPFRIGCRFEQLCSLPDGSCGCDGITYENRCETFYARVPILRDGPYEPPGEPCGRDATGTPVVCGLGTFCCKQSPTEEFCVDDPDLVLCLE